MRTGFAVFGVFVFSLLFLPACSFADDLFIEGKRLFNSGKYQPSYEILEQAFQENPSNLDISFVLGRAAFELGDYEMAVAAFERILIIEPRAPRVKLELARAHLKLGSTEIARQYFLDVLNSNPPAAVKQNIQYFLATIEAAERRHFLTGIVSLGFFYDDNVGVYPNSDTVIIGGLPVLLEGKKESDAGLQVSASLNHLYRFGTSAYSWKSTLTTFNNFYQDLHDEDLSYTGMATGLARQKKQSLWEFQLSAGLVNLDSKKYLDLIGLSLYHLYSLNQTMFCNFTLAFQNKNYQQNDGQDALAWTAAINPVLDYGMNRFSVTAGFEIEDADAAFYSYQRLLTAFRYERTLPFDFNLYGNVRYQHSKYDDEMPLFGEKRKDDLIDFEAGISKTLWRSENRQQSLSVRVSNKYSKSDSNIALYEYDKNVTLTTLTMTF